MPDFAINDFIFSIPIWTVLQNPQEDPDGTSRFNGIANCEVGGHRAVCLFTDADLAQHHMAQFRDSTLAVAKFNKPEHLIYCLEKLEANGLAHVTFDPGIETSRALRPCTVADLLDVLREIT